MRLSVVCMCVSIFTKVTPELKVVILPSVSSLAIEHAAQHFPIRAIKIEVLQLHLLFSLSVVRWQLRLLLLHFVLSIHKIELHAATVRMNYVSQWMFVSLWREWRVEIRNFTSLLCALRALLCERCRDREEKRESVGQHQGASISKLHRQKIISVCLF